MNRLIGCLAIAFALALLPMAARADQGTAAPAKAINAQGAVTAVATDSLTVKGKTDTWTFAVDKDTIVTVKGATHKNLELKAAGKASKLTEFVKVGDTVIVGYHEKGALKHAATIRVTSSPK
jgi:hypothetical protein